CRSREMLRVAVVRVRLRRWVMFGPESSQRHGSSRPTLWLWQRLFPNVSFVRQGLICLRRWVSSRPLLLAALQVWRVPFLGRGRGWRNGRSRGGRLVVICWIGRRLRIVRYWGVRHENLGAWCEARRDEGLHQRGLSKNSAGQSV